MSAIVVNSDLDIPFENHPQHAGAARASAETVKPPLEILLTVGEQARVTDAVLAMIQDDGLLYERGDTLVRPCGDRLIVVDEHWLADYFSRRIAFSRMKTKDGAIERIAADPPNWLCKRINAKSGERGIPELAGILSQPTMRADGSLLDVPGYDAATGLLLRRGDWPTIPTQPRRSDLEVAWRTLWPPYSEFPYVSDDDRAVAVAAILTALVRRTLPLAPAFSFDAPVASSGKTLLAQCVGELCGVAPSIVPECEDGEIRKRILSVLMDGTPAVLFDNIKGLFRSSALEAFLTAQQYSDRVLGISKLVKVPTNVLVLISGNNFVPVGDLWRRILTCRIDPRTEAAHLRTFKRDALQHVRTHRQAMVAAGLTLLRGFITAGGASSHSQPLGSFEVWDRLVRQCVIWMGVERLAPVTDPLVAMNKVKALDPETQKLTAFLASVHAVMGDARWRVAELIAKANAAPLTNEEGQALHDALVQIAGDGFGRINVRILGSWLTKQTDRRCNGLRVERAGILDGNNRWRILAE